MLVALVLTGVPGLPASVTLPASEAATRAFVARDVVSMEAHDGMVYYSTHRDCPLVGEFPTTCRVELSGVTREASDRGVLFESAPSPGPEDIASNVTFDDDFVYWIDAGNHLRRIGDRSWYDDPVVVTSLRDPNAATQIVTDGLYVYWTENSTDGTGRLYRTRGPGTPVDLLVENERHLEDLQADGFGGVLYVTTRPVFFLCCIDVLERVTVAVDGTVTIDRSDQQGVQAYATDGPRVYFIEAVGGSTPELHVAPLDDLSQESVLVMLDGADEPAFEALAVADGHVYWQPYRFSTAGGPVLRVPVGGGVPQPVSGNLTRVTDLDPSTDGVFALAGTAIHKIEFDAEAIFLDIASPTQPEVVQILQSDSHDVPLIDGRDTYVRVYGRLAAVDTPAQAAGLPVPVVLHGTRGGGSLPGSPLRPVQTQNLTGATIERTNMDTTFLFELPSTWRSGTVTLTSEFNPDRALVEIDHTNNGASRTVTFNEVGGTCYDMLPVQTHAGVSEDAWDRATHDSFERALTLMPMDHIRRVYRGGSPRTIPGTFGDHYNMRDGDHTNMLLMNLNAELGWQGKPAACGADTLQRVVYVPDAGRFGKAFGIGPYFFALIWDNRSAPSFVPENEPLGAVSGLAHENGHNLGFAHVLCPTMGTGTPGWPYESVPHDTCSIGSNVHVGFDTMTRTLIVPRNGDGTARYAEFMSYSGPLWTSRYTFDKIYRQFAPDGVALAGVAGSGADAGAAAAVEPGPPGAVVTGFIDEAGQVVMAELFEGEGAPLDELRTRLADPEVVVPSDTLELRTYDVTGAVLSAEPLQQAEHVTEGPEMVLEFMHVISVDPARTRVAVVEAATGAVLAAHDGGLFAPSMTITSPAAGDVVGDEMIVAWTASDLDGDDLTTMVRYSDDGGLSWQVLETLLLGDELAVDTSTMPGGPDVYVEVVTSDGVRSTAARVGPFTVTEHAPDAVILDEAGGVLGAGDTAVMRQSDQKVLGSWAYDAEDGELVDGALSWSVTGPVALSGTGRELALADLTPGTYDVRLIATDSSGVVAVASTTLIIRPKIVPEQALPALDGHCDGAAYDGDGDPITIRLADGGVARARVVTAGGGLWACVSGLLDDADDADGAAVMRLGLDADASGDGVAGGEDVVVEVRPAGHHDLLVGDGAGGLVVVPRGGILDAEVSDHDGRWSAELRLGDDVAPLGAVVRLLFATQQDEGGSGAAAWPVTGDGVSPATWGLATIGDPGGPVVPVDEPPTVMVPDDIIVPASGPAGAVVTFPATADDAEDGPLTPTCVPQSGSLFPIGTTTVTCSATDAAGQGASATFDVIVTPTPYTDKVAARNALARLAPSGDPATDDLIAAAVDAVNGSLAPTLWVDGQHLTEAGREVFNGERDAVALLLSVASPPPGTQAVIDALVDVDRRLAETAVGDGVAAVVGAANASDDQLEDARKALTRAGHELERGWDYVSEGEDVEAINRYRQAWFRAQQALAAIEGS